MDQNPFFPASDLQLRQQAQCTVLLAIRKREKKERGSSDPHHKRNEKKSKRKAKADRSTCVCLCVHVTTGALPSCPFCEHIVLYTFCFSLIILSELLQGMYVHTLVFLLFLGNRLCRNGINSMSDSNVVNWSQRHRYSEGE